MRLNELINENSYESYRDADRHAAFDDIIRNCSVAVKEGAFLYRGMENAYSEKVIVWPASDKHRPSANFHFDYYKHIISHLPSWEGWPDRSKSIICSTDENYAAGYGHNYVVFPIDDAVLGVTPGKDFWDCQILTPKRLRDNNVLPNSSYNYGVNLPIFMRQLLNISVTASPESIIPDAERLGILGDIDAALSPDALGLEMTSVIQVARIMHSHEVWTPSTCYGIQDEIYEEFQHYAMMKELKGS